MQVGSGLVFDGLKLRSDCCELVLALIAHMRGDVASVEFENEIKCKNICTQLTNLLLCTRGGRKSRDLHGAIRWQEYVENQQANIMVDNAQEQRDRVLAKAPSTDGESTQGNFIPRHMMIQRVQIQHLSRLNLLSTRAMRVLHEKYDEKGGAATTGADPALVQLVQRYRQLTEELVVTSSTPYAKVRKAAQKSWSRSMSKQPWLLAEQIPGMLTKLSDSTSGQTDDQATGNLFLLFDQRSLGYVARGGEGYALFAKHLCDSQALVASVSVDRQTKLQNRIFHLFVKHLQVWQPTDASTVTGVIVALLNVLSKTDTSTDSTGDAEMSDSIASDGKLHWRYRLCALAWLTRLVSVSAADLSEEQLMSAWQQFQSAISSESQPLRKVGLLGISVLFDRFSASATGTGPVTYPAGLSKQLCSEKFLEALMEALQGDHRQVVGGNSDSNDASEASSWSFGVGEVLGTMMVRNSQPYPLGRHQTTSPHFSKSHTFLVGNMLQCIATDADAGKTFEELKTILEKFIDDKSDEKRIKQCVVAEVVAGVLVSNCESLVQSSLALIGKAVDDCGLEACAEWVDCTRCVVAHASGSNSNSAAVQVAELVQTQVAARLSAGEETDDSARQSKWLRLLQAVLLEGVSSQSSDAVSVATKAHGILLEQLGHPYKVCREEIARCMVFIQATLRSGNGAGAAGALTPAGAVALVVDAVEKGEVEAKAAEAEAKAKVKAGLDEKDSDSAVKKLQKQRVETALYWLMCTITMADCQQYVTFTCPHSVLIYSAEHKTHRALSNLILYRSAKQFVVLVHFYISTLHSVLFQFNSIGIGNPLLLLLLLPCTGTRPICLHLSSWRCWRRRARMWS